MKSSRLLATSGLMAWRTATALLWNIFMALCPMPLDITTSAPMAIIRSGGSPLPPKWLLSFGVTPLSTTSPSSIWNHAKYGALPKCAERCFASLSATGTTILTNHHHFSVTWGQPLLLPRPCLAPRPPPWPKWPPTVGLVVNLRAPTCTGSPPPPPCPPRPCKRLSRPSLAPCGRWGRRGP